MEKTFAKSVTRDVDRDGVLQAVREDIRVVVTFWGLASLAGLTCLGLYSKQFGLPVFGALASWALGVAMSSATLGFLFGIPKVLQGTPSSARTTATSGGISRVDGAAEPPSYTQRVNTNLEEISDWLTKIIVGVGLVELKQLPTLLVGVARRIQDAAAPAAHGVALSLLAFFGSTGFLFGYLLTRLYLQGALARADQQSASGDLGKFLRESDRVKEGLIKEAGASSSATELAESGLRSLEPLAEEYLKVDDPDPARCLARQDSLAKALYVQAMQAGVSRDELAAQGNEAFILTLASLAHAQPTMDDLPRLLQAGPHVERLHVQYRIVMAVAEILQRRLANPGFVAPTRALLQRYSARSDLTLRSAIDATLKLLETY